VWCWVFIVQEKRQKLMLELRQQMPIADRVVYLDHAAVSAIPRNTAEEISRFATQAAQEGSLRWLEWASKVELTRSLAARTLGCQESEIALIPNTTTGINIVAQGMPWRFGDNVVVPENEFPSNLLPWKSLAHLGVEVRLAPVGPQGEISLDAIRSKMDARTRLVSVSWVGFSSGYRCQLSTISEMVHANGSLLFVDAIQGLGAFALNVMDIPIDFLSADGHKWLMGPEGAGLLYIKSSHMDLLRPLNIGWNSLASDGFDPKSEKLKVTAARYEGGSTNMAGILGLGRSLDLLLHFGTNRPGGAIEQTILNNVADLADLLRSSGYQVEIPSSQDHQSGIIGARWSAADQAGDAIYLRARKFLLARNIVVSVRGGRLRISTHAYNNTEDHRQVVDAINDFRRLLG
jgi:cysteine desulfurase/selenocysteine lyase